MKWYYWIVIPLWLLSIVGTAIVSWGFHISNPLVVLPTTFFFALVICGPWTWKNIEAINEAVYDRPFRNRK